MKGLIHRNVFLLVVFLTGGAVLVVEVAATRILAPWYGNTIFTFSSVISVILAALSIGYYLGGRLADKFPSAHIFFSIILVAGLSVFLSQLLAVSLLPAVGYRLSIMSGPLLLSVAMFFLPGLLMGTLSPWAIKLQAVRNPELGVGTTAGQVFFWSTLGSILGSLAAGFVLIPNFGLNSIMLGTGTLLALLGLVGFAMSGGSTLNTAVITIITLGLGAGAAVASPPRMMGVLYDENGIYERILVRDVPHKGRPARILMQDRAISGLVYMDNGESVDYVKYSPIVNLVKSDVMRALAIGGGSYILPRTLLTNFPDAIVDVAEIEPTLYEVGQKFFGVLPDPRLRNHITDGRRLLHDAQPYDLIYTDVYYALTIPPHFTTVEYHELVRDRLTSGGVYMANLVGDLNPQPPNILFSQMRIIRQVFPNSYFFATVSPTDPGTQSIVAFAINGETPLPLDSPVITESGNPLIKGLPDRLVDTSSIEWEKYAIMTDDYAPAEYFGMQTIRRELTAK